MYTKKTAPPDRFSVAEARSRLADVVKRAEKGTPVQITRRGKPVAVVLGQEEYDRLAARKTSEGFWEALTRFRTTHDLELLDIESIYRDIRDKSPGREPDL